MKINFKKNKNIQWQSPLRIVREKFFSVIGVVITALLINIHGAANCQELTSTDTLKIDTMNHPGISPDPPSYKQETQYDFGNLISDIFHPHKKPAVTKKPPSGIIIIPNIASNPTIGSQIGIKAVAGRKLGKDPNTFMSVAATSASITTKGIIYFYVNHNIYTAGNKWNLQGNLVFAKTLVPDHGLGIGKNSPTNLIDHVLADPERKGYVLHSLYFNFREKIYKEISKGLFVGGGVSFDVRSKIEDRISTTQGTPYNIYSNRYGFSLDHYSANGLLFNVQYTSRDNQNRAYKGIYTDAGFRINQTWLGSTKNAIQFVTDLRKYISLSKKRPEHVIAFWNWGSYLLSGVLPYLELPGTGRDGSFRSGRGYTSGYFKSTKYNDSEVEYRFPITRNKFLSGVGFFSLQTSNDLVGTKLFKYWQPGGGGGLRVLFNKSTRTNLCLDYAFGKYGSKGFFLGLNEAF